METDENFPTNPQNEVELEANIHSLHERFMNGEISQGKMAEMLGIGRSDLIHLLEKMDLQVTNL